MTKEAEEIQHIKTVIKGGIKGNFPYDLCPGCGAKFWDETDKCIYCGTKTEYVPGDGEEKCPTCKGEGEFESGVIHPQTFEKEILECSDCKGKGVI